MTIRARAALWGSAALLLGCDIVQGFQNAGEALFPDTKTYLDSPGYRLASGRFGELDIAYADQIYLVARPADPADFSLLVMRYAEPEPCRLPRVGRYRDFGHAELDRLYLAYFDETDVSRGTLRFADGDCRVSGLSVPDAELPLALRTDGSLLVLAGDDLLAVDPQREQVRPLVPRVTAVVAAYAGTMLAVIADEQLALVETYAGTRPVLSGRGVKSAVTTLDHVFFEDDDGVHDIAMRAVDTAILVTQRVLDPLACHLGSMVLPASRDAREKHLVSYNSPCSSADVVVHDPDEAHTVALAARGDGRHVMLGPAPERPKPPSLDDPFWTFLLRDVDASGEGELVAVTPDGDELSIGRTSAVARTVIASRTLAGEPGYDHGFALLDVEGEVGRYVLFTRDGQLRELARGVPIWELDTSWPAIVTDFDGTLANLAQLARGEVVPLVSGIPPSGYARPNFRDLASGDTLLFHDFDGASGSLSLAEPVTSSPAAAALDDFGMPLRRPRAIAKNVGRFLRSFLDDVPGYVYVTRFDAAARAGRLEYHNTELVFTGTVNEGVADFLQPGNGVLYSVAAGPNAGIWLAHEK